MSDSVLKYLTLYLGAEKNYLGPGNYEKKVC
jgi:hypothetical protein